MPIVRRVKESLVSPCFLKNSKKKTCRLESGGIFSTGYFLTNKNFHRDITILWKLVKHEASPSGNKFDLLSSKLN